MYAGATVSPPRPHRSTPPPSASSPRHAQMLEDRVARLSSLVDCLKAPSKAGDRAVPPAKSGSIEQQYASLLESATALNASSRSAPDSGRADLQVVNQRLGEMDRKVNSLEATVTRLLAQVEEQHERIQADTRTIEHLRAALRESETSTSEVLRKLVGAAEHQDAVERRKEDFINKRMEQLSAAAEQKWAVGVAKLESRHADFEARAAGIEATFQSLRGDVGNIVKRGLTAVNAQVDAQIAAALQQTAALADRWEADRVKAVEQRESCGAMVRDAVASMAPLKSDLETVRLSQDRLQADVKHLQEEAKVLSRRLTSAVRHLAVSDSAQVSFQQWTPVPATRSSELPPAATPPPPAVTPQRFSFHGDAAPVARGAKLDEFFVDLDRFAGAALP